MPKFSEFDNFGVEKMEGAEYQDRLQKIEQQCLCSGCPSFVAGDKNKSFCFPANGASNVIKVEKECLCQTCPVYKESELNSNHYCTRCSQLCQTNKAIGTSGP